MSDEDLTKEIAMNPYLQYFLGLREYRYECPFDASMMTRFRQRISAEMLAWVNDEIIGRSTAAEGKEEDHRDNDTDNTGSSSQEESKGAENEEENQGENEGRKPGNLDSGRYLCPAEHPISDRCVSAERSKREGRRDH